MIHEECGGGGCCGLMFVGCCLWVVVVMGCCL